MTGTADPSLRALVNSVIWPGFTGLSAPDWLKRALDDSLAGVVYFGHNIDPDAPEQPAALSRELRQWNPAAVIGVDEEGGNVSRLESARGSSLPSHAQLGRYDDTAVTRSVGAALALRVAAAGANLVLAPVADVNTDRRNPVIGVRSFGSDTALVARHVAAMAQGIQNQRISARGVAACVKHFPGHGDTRADSHHELPRVDADWEQFERVHLPPFASAIAAGVKAVMSAHIVVPRFGELPATLNPRILSMLRDAGFDGVIVTDALDMAAIRKTVGVGAGAVRAIAAGADLLCVGNPSNLGPKAGTTRDEDDYREVRDALLDAVADGSLPVAALERAGGRVAALAAWTSDAPVVPAGAKHATGGHPDLSEAVRQVITVTGTLPSARHTDPKELVPLPATTVLDLRRAATVAVASTADVFTEALRERRPLTKISIDLTDRGAGEGVASVVSDSSGGALIVLVDAIGAAGAQSAALERVARTRSDAVVVNSGVPGATSAAIGLAVIDTYGGGRLAAGAVADVLTREAGTNSG